jgi:hypothetical protein
MSNDVTSIRCYIEEYDTTTGSKGARLREKGTTRKVILGTTTQDEQQQFLRFLLAGRANRAAMPALFDTTDEQDCVLVTGQLASDDPEAVTFVYDETLSYPFA